MQLPDESVHFGYKILYFREIDSTNEYAWNYLSKNNPTEKTAIITSSQYAGRGQYDRKWHSTPGKNITLSVIMALNGFDLQKGFHLNIMVSISIIRAIRAITGIKASVKWPNDIYLNGKKLGGILIKNKVSGMSIEHTVIGIGLNVNQADFDTSAPNAISLIQTHSRNIDLWNLYEGILTQLSAAFDKYYSKGIDDYYMDYREHLFAKGEYRNYILKGDPKRLAIKEVDPLGTLHLYDEDEVKYSINGDLVYIF